MKTKNYRQIIVIFKKLQSNIENSNVYDQTFTNKSYFGIKYPMKN